MERRTSCLVTGTQREGPARLLWTRGKGLEHLQWPRSVQERLGGGELQLTGGGPSRPGYANICQG